MLESGTLIVERSELFVRDLIQRRDLAQETVTTSDLVGKLVAPASMRDLRRAKTQLLFIAGGAASGKSTLAENITHGLAAKGLKSATISSDDFVRWDRKKRHQGEARGMSPEEKYDFFEMRRAIGAICSNQKVDETVEVPRYDPHTGLAIDGEWRQQIPKVDVLIAEGDMFGRSGTMPQDLSPVRPAQAFDPLTFYIHVPDTTRLARRIERDMLKRNAQGATPDDIARSFEHRQATQHYPYTLRYAADADAILMPLAGDANWGPQTYNMYQVGYH